MAWCHVFLELKNTGMSSRSALTEMAKRMKIRPERLRAANDANDSETIAWVGEFKAS